MTTRSFAFVIIIIAASVALLLLLLTGTENSVAAYQRIRRKLVEQEEPTSTRSWGERLRNKKDFGAEVFQITFSDSELNNPDLQNLNITTVTQKRGVNGNPRNRYIWSMALDDNEELYIGTMNNNLVFSNFTDLVKSILRAPWCLKWDALVDALLRQWSGLPIFEHEGGQIYRYNNNIDDFDLVLQADPDYVGFRGMINYQGHIYAGSTNGPDGPYDGKPYDFKFYENSTGAKIFTNTGGNGNFEILDDEGYIDGYDKSIRAMCVSSHSDRLFIGTETWECAKILVYKRTPGAGDTTTSTWKKIELEGDDCTVAVSKCLDLGGGKLLFGTWGQFGYNVYLLDETENDSLTKLNTPNLWYHVSCGVMELRVFKGQLYLGILSFVNGFALVRTPKLDSLTNLKRSDWEVITPNGFAKEQKEQLGARIASNEYPWSSAEINGIYFIGTFNSVTRGVSLEALDMIGKAQLWASLDGENWQIIRSDLFEDSPFMYGFRSMQATKDQKTLYIGSAVNMYIPVK